MSMPDTPTILHDLRKMSVDAAANLYNVKPNSIRVKLRKAGFGRGKSISKKATVLAFSPPPPLGLRQKVVVRTTITGRKITLPRVSFIDAETQSKSERAMS